jgi:hypothetical protein
LLCLLEELDVDFQSSLWESILHPLRTKSLLHVLLHSAQAFLKQRDVSRAWRRPTSSSNKETIISSPCLISDSLFNPPQVLVCLAQWPDAYYTTIEMHFSIAIVTLILRLLFFIYATRAQSNYWVANIPRQGQPAFSPNASTYQIYRNVKDFGAEGSWALTAPVSCHLVHLG